MILAPIFGKIHPTKTKQEDKTMVFGFIQNCGPWQIVILVVVAFVLFGGAKKIPDLARSLGKAKNEFKKGLAEGEKEGADEDFKAKKEDEPAKELA